MIEGLSHRLRDQRAKCGYSRAVVAENVGVTASTIADYENGHVEPSLKVLIRLSSLYKCTTDYLLGLKKVKTEIVLDGTGLNQKQVDAVIRLIHVMNE